MNDIYKKNGAEGAAYPGVVTEVEDYRTRCGTARIHSAKWKNTFDCTEKKERKEIEW